MQPLYAAALQPHDAHARMRVLPGTRVRTCNVMQTDTYTLAPSTSQPSTSTTHSAERACIDSYSGSAAVYIRLTTRSYLI